MVQPLLDWVVITHRFDITLRNGQGKSRIDLYQILSTPRPR
ncbi:MAG TPA: hypothetical protein VES89_00720 [Candidatus Competibacteraceae bacterium]|nr:hypothetical protein [Candidatus Competibacteraceae bacterium]